MGKSVLENVQFLDRNGHANNFLNIIGRDVPFKYVIACSFMIPKKQIRPKSVHGNTVTQGQTRGPRFLPPGATNHNLLIKKIYCHVELLILFQMTPDLCRSVE